MCFCYCLTLAEPAATNGDQWLGALASADPRQFCHPPGCIGPPGFSLLAPSLSRCDSAP